jgi:hypothetical protein
VAGGCHLARFCRRLPFGAVLPAVSASGNRRRAEAVPQMAKQTVYCPRSFDRDGLLERLQHLIDQIAVDHFPANLR